LNKTDGLKTGSALRHQLLYGKAWGSILLMILIEQKYFFNDYLKSFVNFSTIFDVSCIKQNI
jgi:hypothetical protein